MVLSTLEVLAEANGLASLDEQIAKLVLDVDSLATALVVPLCRSKRAAIRDLAQQICVQSQSVRMSICLDRPALQIMSSADDLHASVSSLQLLCSKSRLDNDAKLGLQLLGKLITRLRGNLSVWGSPDLATN